MRGASVRAEPPATEERPALILQVVKQNTKAGDCRTATILLPPPLTRRRSPAAAGGAAWPLCRLRKMAAPKVTPVVLMTTFVGWLTALSVVALVPIDVYSSLAHDDPGPLAVLWSISYWCALGCSTRLHSSWCALHQTACRCRRSLCHSSAAA